MGAAFSERAREFMFVCVRVCVCMCVCMCVCVSCELVKGNIKPEQDNSVLHRHKCMRLCYAAYSGILNQDYIQRGRWCLKTSNNIAEHLNFCT